MDADEGLLNQWQTKFDWSKFEDKKFEESGALRVSG